MPHDCKAAIRTPCIVLLSGQVFGVLAKRSHGTQVMVLQARSGFAGVCSPRTPGQMMVWVYCQHQKTTRSCNVWYYTLHVVHLLHYVTESAHETLLTLVTLVKCAGTHHTARCFGRRPGRIISKRGPAQSWWSRWSSDWAKVNHLAAERLSTLN